MIALGQHVRDTVTGFAGVATARTEYAFDAPSVRVTAIDTGQDDSKFWFTEGRLEPVDDERVTGFGS